MKINEPRSGDIIISGIPWLARMIDKARLDASGHIDSFDLEYPCPMDQRLLGQLRINEKEFQQIAIKSKTDEDVVMELKKRNCLPV